MLWTRLVHSHIVPFLGVSEDVFEGTLCMVLPWMENGSLREYLVVLRRDRKLADEELVAALNKWVRRKSMYRTRCYLD